MGHSSSGNHNQHSVSSAPSRANHARSTITHHHINQSESESPLSNLDHHRHIKFWGHRTIEVKTTVEPSQATPLKAKEQTRAAEKVTSTHARPMLPLCIAIPSLVKESAHNIRCSKCNASLHTDNRKGSSAGSLP